MSEQADALISFTREIDSGNHKNQIDKSTNIQTLIVQEHHRIIQINHIHINVQHGSWI